jgi:hypothetical protein
MRNGPATRRSTPKHREADARAARWLEALLDQGERACSATLERAKKPGPGRPATAPRQPQ